MLKVIVFLELMFGFLIVVRILGELQKKNWIDTRAMTKIVAGYLVWILVWAALPNFSVVSFSIVLWLPLICLHFAPHILAKIRRKQFRQELPIMLSHLILGVRAGQSFRSALQSSSQNLTDFSKNKMNRIIEDLFLPENQKLGVKTMGGVSHEWNQNPHATGLESQAEELVTFFRDTDKDAHQTLSRLEQLRYKLKIEDDFRQKSNRALQQLRAQAYVMSGLYGLLLLFVLYRFGWKDNTKIIVFSALLYSLGLILILIQGRRFKWKV